MDYWAQRKKYARKASKWVDYIKQNYADEIDQCIMGTTVVDGDIMLSVRMPESTDPKYSLVQCTTVNAIKKLPEGRHDNVMVLNFGSYKEPGGKFLAGSYAQEETLCHNSILYPVLEASDEYYEYNRDHMNRGMYGNRALYSRDVVFFPDTRPTTCNVLTCSAPNNNVSLTYHRFTQQDNKAALEWRIIFICEFIKRNVQYFDSVILGAFGCGVFRQDPKIVATFFKKYLKNCGLKHVVFAIPDNENMSAFRSVFKLNVKHI